MMNNYNYLIGIAAALMITPVIADDQGWGAWDDEPEVYSPWQPLSGFAEAGLGYRTQSDTAGLGRDTLREARVRVESGYQGDNLTGTLRGDLRFDAVVEGWEVDLRDLSLSYRLSAMDIKAGRQVLTWGTGDYLFLNDLFAKDWQAFFSGLDNEYLKAPMNAVRTNWYSQHANFDFIWIPKFESDNYLTGERFSFFDPIQGEPIAPGFDADEPNKDVWAARVYGTHNQMEWAIYGYWGYTGQPLASTPEGRPTFAELHAYGASLLMPVGAGLLNLETSFHKIRDQDNGNNPLQPLDTLLGLIGYQQELITNLTLGLQYQIEHRLDYDSHRQVTPVSEQYAMDRNRHLTTLRLDYRAYQERLTLSLFSFYSPSDNDFYLRPQTSYRLDDNWFIAAGFNLLNGDKDHTFFGQMADNSNGWLRLRYYY